MRADVPHQKERDNQGHPTLPIASKIETSNRSQKAKAKVSAKIMKPCAASKTSREMPRERNGLRMVGTGGLGRCSVDTVLMNAKLFSRASGIAAVFEP